MDKQSEGIVSKLKDYIGEISDLIDKCEDASEMYIRRLPRSFPAYKEAQSIIGQKFDLVTDGLISYIQNNISTREAIKCKMLSDRYYRNFKDKLEAYKIFLTRLKDHPDQWNKLITSGSRYTSIPVDSSFENIKLICNRFDHIAKQLRKRRSNKLPFEIEDEYDVQDLIHALLRIYFNDIRPEEHTPSLASKTNRMDFLLKEEQIVLETKLASNKYKDRKIEDDLVLDIAHYKEHPDCKQLVCFIYDPGKNLDNPAGLISGLEKQSSEGYKIKVMINPS